MQRWTEVAVKMVEVKLEEVYGPSEGVVAREIEGELIIVPLAAGIGDLEDELYTLNETGKVVWQRLGAGQRLGAVVESLRTEYDAADGEIERDVVGLVAELVRRGMLVEAVDA